MITRRNVDSYTQLSTCLLSGNVTHKVNSSHHKPGQTSRLTFYVLKIRGETARDFY